MSQESDPPPSLTCLQHLALVIGRRPSIYVPST